MAPRAAPRRAGMSTLLLVTVFERGGARAAALRSRDPRMAELALKTAAVVVHTDGISDSDGARTRGWFHHTLTNWYAGGASHGLECEPLPEPVGEPVGGAFSLNMSGKGGRLAVYMNISD